MNKMKFFTDKTVKNDYLLIKIKDYLNLRKKENDFSQWKEVFIDPGVYDLTKSDKFKWEGTINIPEFLDSLPDNHYFSWDYPCDMNIQFQDYFLKKSWDNAVKYCKHHQYIITVQSKFNNYMDFVNCFNKYNDLNIVSGIMGLGNMCRFAHLNQYMKHALDYAFSHCIHPRIHIYGLAIRSIPYAYKLAKRFNIDLSIDSTKWTRAISHFRIDLDHYNVRNKEERQEFFDEYLKEIRKRGVKLD